MKITSHVITTPIFLKIMSCVMGFFVWYSISNSRVIIRTITIPLYFDNKTEDMHIEAPETTQITVSGTRAQLKNIAAHGAVHIDTRKIARGKQLFHATYRNFLLPSAVKVLNYMPIEVTSASIKTADEQ